MVPRLYRSGSSSVGAPVDRIQFQMTLHEEDEENVDEKDQVGNGDPIYSDKFVNCHWHR